jgi:nucleoside 2-deoxyribosyltransferase
MTMKLYIAGPLFTPYHRGQHARTAARLRREGYVCFVPQEFSAARAFGTDTGTLPTPINIFDDDYDMVREADAIVALLDDPDVSSGLACELGIFWMMMHGNPAKKGILGLLTDERAYRRLDAGMPPVNAFTLGCVLDVGNIYNNLDNILAHLNGWRAGLSMPKGAIKR